MRMQKAQDYLALGSHCESEAAKAQDKFLRYQLLSFAESYRTLAESTAALERSAEALENMRRRAQGRMLSAMVVMAKLNRPRPALLRLMD